MAMPLVVAVATDAGSGSKADDGDHDGAIGGMGGEHTEDDETVPGEGGVPFAGAERPQGTIARRGAAAAARAAGLVLGLALWCKAVATAAGAALRGREDVPREAAERFSRAAGELIRWIGKELAGYVVPSPSILGAGLPASLDARRLFPREQFSRVVASIGGDSANVDAVQYLEAGEACSLRHEGTGLLGVGVASLVTADAASAVCVPVGRSQRTTGVEAEAGQGMEAETTREVGAVVWSGFRRVPSGGWLQGRAPGHALRGWGDWTESESGEGGHEGGAVVAAAEDGVRGPGAAARRAWLAAAVEGGLLRDAGTGGAWLLGQ